MRRKAQPDLFFHGVRVDFAQNLHRTGSAGTKAATIEYARVAIMHIEFMPVQCIAQYFSLFTGDGFVFKNNGGHN